jgi:pimeloyl-ACP methyl ester carboxylesterase
MPFATNRGVKTYYEIAGEGPTIVCHHGAGGSSADWREFGYAAGLGDHYRLAMVDGRGYGQSDRPHDVAAFADEVLAGDVVAVLDDLGIERGIYWGYSMGASVGFRSVAQFARDRFSAFIFGGNSAYPGGSVSSSKITMRDVFAAGANEGMAAALLLFEQMMGKVSPERAARFQTIDPRSFLARNDARAAEPFNPDAVLAKIDVPCLVYAGSADGIHHGARKTAEHIAGARFISLPGLDHLRAYNQGALVLPHVREFLAGIG